LLDDIEQDSAITGVVIYSAKDNSFVAGADVSMLELPVLRHNKQPILLAVDKQSSAASLIYLFL
jgi:enoyl-CoA hydratase/carnithine racemase